MVPPRPRHHQLPARRSRLLSPSAALLLLVALVAAGCGRTVANRNPVGERFPQVAGTALDGRAVTLPDDLAGAPALLLVGYVMEAQFDLDRWLIGVAQAGLGVRVLEVPTIEGMLPGLYAGTIDEGMRRGIPSEDWGLVVTVYDDAPRIVELTGNERPRNGRVLALDAEGRVVWFHDRGFSAGRLLDLQRTLDALPSSDAP